MYQIWTILFDSTKAGELAPRDQTTLSWVQRSVADIIGTESMQNRVLFIHKLAQIVLDATWWKISLIPSWFGPYDAINIILRGLDKPYECSLYFDYSDSSIVFYGYVDKEDGKWFHSVDFGRIQKDGDRWDVRFRYWPDELMKHYFHDRLESLVNQLKQGGQT